MSFSNKLNLSTRTLDKVFVILFVKFFISDSCSRVNDTIHKLICNLYLNTTFNKIQIQKPQQIFKNKTHK